MALPVSRGMTSDPTGRWPDMSALLTALEQMIAPKTRWWWIAAGILTAAAATAVWANRGAPCTSGDEELAETWNDGARARVGLANRVE